MSNRVSISDENFTGVKRIAKARGIEPGEAVEFIVKTGLSRLKALGKYADNKAEAAGKETGHKRKPKGLKKVKKEKAEKTEKKAAKVKAAPASSENKPKRKKKEKQETEAAKIDAQAEEFAFN